MAVIINDRQSHNKINTIKLPMKSNRDALKSHKKVKATTVHNQQKVKATTVYDQLNSRRNSDDRHFDTNNLTIYQKTDNNCAHACYQLKR